MHRLSPSDVRPMRPRTHQPEGAARPRATVAPADGRATAFDWSGCRVGLLFNNKSGESKARDLAEGISGALRGLGADVPRPAECAADFAGQLASLRGRSPDVIVAIGGDGTANAGACVARAVDAALMIVPAGTMDLVAHDLGMPMEFPSMLEAVPHLVEARIDCATVNGAMFLHSSMLGIVPTLTRIRESMREASSWMQWMGGARSFVLSAARAPKFTVELESERGGVARRTRSLAVTCNTLVDAQPVQYHRETLVGGRLGVYTAMHTGPLASVRVILSLARARLRSDREVDHWVCAMLRVRTRRRRVVVSNDGELVELSTPLEYAVVPKGVRVLVPGATRGGSPT